MYAGKLLLIIISSGFCLLPLAAQENKFPVPTGNSKQLFYLQRNHNVNTIVYELNYKNGMVFTPAVNALYENIIIAGI